MRLSIIISTHNRAELLRQTLEALRRQRYEPGDEVIVVDNASTDHTAAVIAAAAAASPVPLIGLSELRKGKSFGLNRALEDASGDIIALTDDDVLVAEDWTETLRRIFSDPAVRLVGGRVDPRWENSPPDWLRVEEHGQYGGITAPLALLHYGARQELRDRTVVGANMAVRRDVLTNVGGFATHLGRTAGTLLCGEDYDLCARAIAAGHRCEYHPELRVRHWVPAERLRLAYFVRWFFWSGITEVMLERTAPWPHVPAPARRNLPREFVSGLVRSAYNLLVGRKPQAALHLTDAMCALGRMTQHVRDWWRGKRSPSTTQPRPLRSTPPLASSESRQ